MDRAALEDLFAFTDYSWRRYADLLRPLGDDTLTKPAPGSGWPALRDALVHIVWAYLRWLEHPDRTSTTPPEQIDTWDALEDYRKRIRAHSRSYLDSISDHDLTTPDDMNIDGTTMRYSPADIFTHVLLHERQHHGDLNTLLHQLGIDVPVVEYRFSLAG